MSFGGRSMLWHSSIPFLPIKRDRAIPDGPKLEQALPCGSAGSLLPLISNLALEKRPQAGAFFFVLLPQT